MDSYGTRRDPGGYVGLIVLLDALAIGFIFGVQWLQTCAGAGVFIWFAMAVFGFLMGARR